MCERDPEKIEELLNRLKVVWNRVPSLRLGQLVLNLMSMWGSDIYYIEDEQLIQNLEDFYREGPSE